MDNEKSKNKQWFNLLGLIFIVTFSFFILMIIVSKKQPSNLQKHAEKLKYESPLNKVNDAESILERAQKSSKLAQEKSERAEAEVKRLSSQQAVLFEAMQQKIEQLESKRTMSLGKSDDPFASNDNDKLQQAAIRHDTVLQKKPINTVVDVDKKTPETYVPAGAFATGVLLEGADTAGSVNAQTDPEPMLVKLISNGTLPNGHHSSLKGCIITLAATGDVSSERGKIRTERMSCVRKNGSIIDIPVEGNVAGKDGKNGVRGNPVWREGALLQRAFAAGALSGFSDGISKTYSTTAISPLGATQTQDNNKILQMGMASGAGKAMDRLADYNIRRAEQYHPVIQISADNEVTVVFLKGFYLREDNQKKTAVINKFVNSSFDPNSFQSQLDPTNLKKD